ncbi:MAG TPA: DegT/DnrJ/EryC1/StrS family aminotransferase [Candidatus Thermoplasmatota archaeon]|nr:DegT/DnrJ/EryC1/StrS family aminotransferase [Candidatus Thermoplasmatota archaeon]
MTGDGAAETIEQVNRLVDKYFSRDPASFSVPKGRLPLVVPSYGPEEVKEAVEALLTSYVTMGAKVRQFEEAWSQYLGSRSSIMVNSGSSANLLALFAAANPHTRGRLMPGDEVLVPAMCWSTTVYPIVQAGAIPVLVDVDPQTLTMDPQAARAALTDKTRAIMPVHLLGNAADMRELSRLADERDLWLIEDCCEAHGTTIDGRKVGTFGDLGTYSFFFSHAITTIEGGAINTDDDDLAELLRPLRAHGWIREMKTREAIAARHPNVDPRFFFVNVGFNVRPTDLQGGFGIHQVRKLESFVEARRRYAHAITKGLSRHASVLELPTERPGTRHSYFTYPVIVREGARFRKEDLMRHLEAHGVETRPIISGNFAEHPAFGLLPARVAGSLPAASHAHRDGFLFGAHHRFGEEQARYVVECFDSFLRKQD